MPPRSKPPPVLTAVSPPPIEIKNEVAVKTEKEDESGIVTVTDDIPVCSDDSLHRRKKQKVSRRGASDLVPAIPAAVFRRLVREITSNIKSDLRWEADALNALQEDAEAYLISHFGQANKNRVMCGAGTLKKAHFAVA